MRPSNEQNIAIHTIRHDDGVILCTHVSLHAFPILRAPENHCA